MEQHDAEDGDGAQSVDMGAVTQMVMHGGGWLFHAKRSVIIADGGRARHAGWLEQASLRPVCAGVLLAGHRKRRRVLLRAAPRNDRQKRLRQGALEGAGLAPRRVQPDLPLLPCGQDDRHRLGVDRRDDGVGLAGQEAEQLVLTVHRIGLRAAPAGPACPKAGEEGERAFVRQGEPDHVLASGAWIRLRRVFAKAGEGHETAMRRSAPRPPMRGGEVADVRHRRAGQMRRRGHAPAGQRQFARPVRRRADDGGRLVREDAGLRRQVAGEIVQRADQVGDSLDVRSVAVEIAHACRAWGARPGA